MTDYLNEFVKECESDSPETTDDKFIGWEELLFTLVGFGLKALVPELKEWIKLGTSAIALKRLEIKKQLIDYAEKRNWTSRQQKKLLKSFQIKSMKKI